MPAWDGKTPKGCCIKLQRTAERLLFTDPGEIRAIQYIKGKPQLIWVKGRAKSENIAHDN